MKAKGIFFVGSIILTIVLFFVSLSTAKILVISPHPDDDVITAAGITYQAVQNQEPIGIIYMTNGDFQGIDSGYLRQGEAANAQAYLGMIEDNLIFLGYPDGYLDTIYYNYVNVTDIFITTYGQSTTYGNRGLGRTDYHSYRFGVPADYNKYNILLDLEDIISTFKPDHIFTLSQFDVNPDHSTTYELMRLAVLSVINNDPNYNPTIHKTIVHWGSDAWPNSMDPTAYFAEIPDLFSWTGLNWNDRESIEVPLAMQSTSYWMNPKYLAVSAHASQDGANGFLGRFIHRDEIFWVENFVAIPGTLSVTPVDGLSASGTQGGPFNPSSKTYTLQNRGGTAINWSASNIQGWVSISSSGGSMAAGASTTVTVSINSGANSLGTGSYSDTVSFTNTTNGNGNTTRLVALTVQTSSYQNIAPLAAVTASSETPQYGQLAIKAVDGVIDGYPGDYTKEWATSGGRAGSWLQLNWSVPYTVDKVILYDRPNLNDNILSATLSFSDGSTLVVGPLNNGGAGGEYTFPPKVITSLTMTVNSVSGGTQNIGLAEIEIFGTPSTVTQYTLTVNVNPLGAGAVSKSPNKSTYLDGEQVTLTATANTGYAFSNWSGDASGTQNPVVITMNGDKMVEADFAAIPGTLSVTPVDGLSASGTQGGPFSPSSKTYTLQNTGGTAINWSASNTQGWVSLSSSGGSMAAGASTTVTVSINSGANSLGTGSYSDTVSFTNTTNGNGNTTRLVALTVQTSSYQNIAPLAAVTASSETPQYGQLAIKAVDGVIDGYPGDYTKEWATSGGRAGSWLQLNWSVPYTVDKVILYDRPNLNDNILSATLSFSDGSTLVVGPLNNGGAGGEYTFPPKVITSLTMTVNSVSGGTQNIGLAEIEVFGY